MNQRMSCAPSNASLFPAPQHRGKLDGNEALIKWCNDLEAAVIETIRNGQMTKDLAICVHGNKVRH